MRHPRLAWMQRLAWMLHKAFSIRLKILAKQTTESESGQHLAAQARKIHQRAVDAGVRIYLAVTRVGGCKPARYAMVKELPVKQLLAELEARGVDTSDFCERDELLEALCDPMSDEAAEISTTSVDKMV